MFTLAHLSDWHTTPLDGARVTDMLGKRFFGWLSWNIRRGRIHRPEVLRALFEDVRAQAPDHIAITGDLTNVALASEFRGAAAQLAELGTPEEVSLIPGNHDAYVSIDFEKTWDLWADFMRSDAAAGPAPREADFPTLRERGPVSIVGVCTALPTPLFRATGRVGAGQLDRLESLLGELGARDRFRVILLHHPPNDTTLSSRRRLVDSADLRAVVERAGAELVLHGHGHRTMLDTLPGPRGPVPVAGVRSASDVGEKEHKRAQYHLYRIDRSGEGWRVGLRVRGWDPATRSVVDEGERALG